MEGPGRLDRHGPGRWGDHAGHRDDGPEGERACPSAPSGLVPAQCQQCSGILDGLFAQAKAEGLRFDLVGAPERLDELRSLDRATGNGGSNVLLDDGDELAAAYGEGVLTVLVVAPDGIVAEVLRDPDRDASIQPTLSRLYHRTTTAA